MRLLDVSWFPANGEPAILYIYLFFNVFVGVCMFPFIAATYNSMYADIADAHELQTGKRREGAI